MKQNNFKIDGSDLNVETHRDSNVKKFIFMGFTVYSTVVLFATMFFPFATDLFSSTPIKPVDVLGFQNQSILNLFLFIALFLSNVISVIVLVNCLRKRSGCQGLIVYNTVVTALYYVGGVSYSTVMNTRNEVFSSNAAVVPFVLELVAFIGCAVIVGELTRKEMKVKKEKRGDRTILRRLEFWFYGLVSSAFAVIVCTTDIIRVTFIQPAVIDDFVINGYKVITSYNNHDKGTQLLAFLIICILTLTITAVLLSLFSLLSRSSFFESITLFQVMLSMIATLLIGLFGQYYEIVQSVSESMILKWISSQLPFVSFEMTYRVNSISIYWFFATLAVLLIMLIRKPYTKCRQLQVCDVSDQYNTPDKNNETKEKEKEVSVASMLEDPCPVFTSIELQSKGYASEVSKVKGTEDEHITLQSIVNFVVDYARESRLHLIYSKNDIAAFVAGLGVTRLTILQGMSGTGKTSLPKIFSEAVFGRSHVIEIESSWRDKNELLGYYNEFSRIYTPKKFTQALYSSKLDEDRINIIVLDEMNLSRIEYYFSDFISLLENEEDKREVTLVNNSIFRYKDGKRIAYKGIENGNALKMPSNVWFVGTANRDESTYGISDKVYDRAHTMNFNQRAPKVNYGQLPLEPIYVSPKTLNSLFEKTIEDFRFDIETSHTVKSVEELLAPYNIRFGNRIAKHIEEFVSIYSSCMGGGSDAVNDGLETILLSKVVYKLEYKNVYNKEALADEFDRLGLGRCAEFVRTLDEV